MVNTTDKTQLSEYGNMIFSKHPKLDSCIFLRHEKENIFDFLVYERDGSFSVVCGNGLGGAMQYVQQEYGLQKGIFQNRLWEQILAEIDQEKISVTLSPWTLFLSEDEEHMMTQKKIPDIFTKIKLLAEKDRLGDIETICENKNQALYFYELFTKLTDDADFEKLCQSLHLKTGYRIAGEPHVIIECDVADLSDYMRDTYLKAVSFCLRDRGFLGGWEVNYMFFDRKNMRIFPSERGVNNGVLYDQTGACGSGTLAVGNMLFSENDTQKNIDISQRSGQTLRVSRCQDALQLSFDRRHITDMQDKQETSFHADAVYDRWCYQMEKYCGISVIGKSYEEIFTLLEHQFPKEIRHFHEIFWNMLLSSCLHESEFPIDPYKISSSILWAHLMKKMWQEIYYDPYLDTLPIRTNELKGNMNISVINPEISGEKTTFLRKIITDFFDETSWNLTKDDIRDILRSLEKRDFRAELTDIRSERVRVLLQKIRKHFANMFEKENILYAGFLQEISQKTGIDSLAHQLDFPDILQTVHIPGKKEKNGNIKTKNEKWWLLKSGGWTHLATTSIQGVRHDFLDFLFGQKMYHALHELYPSIITNTIKNRNLHISGENEKIKALHQSIQNAVMTLASNTFLSQNTQHMLRDAWMLDRRNRFEKELSSKDGQSEKYAQVFSLLFSEQSELWEDFFQTYLKILCKKPWWLGTFSYRGNTGELRALHTEHGIEFFYGKDAQVLPLSEVKTILQNKENIVNLSGGMMLFVFLLSGVAMIGSERGYREAFVEAWQKHFSGKYSPFIAFTRGTYMVGDYTPGQTHYAFPAGTDYTPFWDILTETLVFWPESGKQMMQDFSHNIIQTPHQISPETLLLLLRESEIIIEDRYQIQEKMRHILSEERKIDSHMQDIIHQAMQYAQTPKALLEKLYAQFQFAKLYKEYI